MTKAVRFDEYGGVDVLQVLDIEIPEPAQGEVQVVVKAAGARPSGAGGVADWLMGVLTLSTLSRLCPWDESLCLETVGASGAATQDAEFGFMLVGLRRLRSDGGAKWPT